MRRLSSSGTVIYRECETYTGRLYCGWCARAGIFRGFGCKFEMFKCSGLNRCFCLMNVGGCLLI